MIRRGKQRKFLNEEVLRISPYMKPATRELVSILQGIVGENCDNLEEILARRVNPEGNPYFQIIYQLGEYGPLRGKKMSRRVGISVCGRIAKLKEFNIVKMDEFGRYYLTPLGEKIYKALKNIGFQPSTYSRRDFNKIFIKK